MPGVVPDTPAAGSESGSGPTEPGSSTVAVAASKMAPGTSVVVTATRRAAEGRP
jgi:hypothetical protein